MPGATDIQLAENARRVLVIRRDNVGDMVCTTPLLRALKQNLKKEVAVLGNAYNEEVLYLNPDVERVYVYPDSKSGEGVIKKYWKRAKLAAAIRSWRPGIIILAKSGYDYHGLKYARRIGYGCVIGYAPPLDSGMPEPDISIPWIDFSNVHEVLCLGKLLQPLGYCETLGELCLIPDPQLQTNVDHGLSQLEETEKKLLFISALVIRSDDGAISVGLS